MPSYPILLDKVDRTDRFTVKIGIMLTGRGLNCKEKQAEKGKKKGTFYKTCIRKLVLELFKVEIQNAVIVTIDLFLKTCISKSTKKTFFYFKVSEG